jgi:hypothetical protein
MLRRIHPASTDAFGEECAPREKAHAGNPADLRHWRCNRRGLRSRHPDASGTRWWGRPPSMRRPVCQVRTDVAVRARAKSRAPASHAGPSRPSVSRSAQWRPGEGDSTGKVAPAPLPGRLPAPAETAAAGPEIAEGKPEAATGERAKPSTGLERVQGLPLGCLKAGAVTDRSLPGCTGWFQGLQTTARSQGRCAAPHTARRATTSGSLPQQVSPSSSEPCPPWSSCPRASPHFTCHAHAHAISSLGLFCQDATFHRMRSEGSPRPQSSKASSSHDNQGTQTLSGGPRGPPERTRPALGHKPGGIPRQPDDRTATKG